MNPFETNGGCCHCGERLNDDDRRWCGKGTVTCRLCMFNDAFDTLTFSEALAVTSWRRLPTLARRLPHHITPEEAHCD